VGPYISRTTKDTLRRFVPEPAHRTEEHQVQQRVLGYVADDDSFVNLYYYFSAAAEKYQLGTYDVDVTVLKADHVWPVHRDDYYWSEYVTGSLEWRSVEGDHHSMFYPERAPRLASTVSAVLREVDSSSGTFG
jgi:thioesterase domain-containing protein